MLDKQQNISMNTVLFVCLKELSFSLDMLSLT